MNITLGLIAHLIGDYLLQNNWMAVKKTSHILITTIHGIMYGILFYFITKSMLATTIIIATHIFIDRFRLAVYWIKLVNWSWDSDNYGYSETTPFGCQLG